MITDFGLAGALTAQSGDLAGAPAYIRRGTMEAEGSASRASDSYALRPDSVRDGNELQPFGGKCLISRSTCELPTRVEG